MRFEVLTLGGWTTSIFFASHGQALYTEVCSEPKMIALVTVLAYTIEEEGKF